MPRDEQNTHPSGLTRTFPVHEDFPNVTAWNEDLLLEMDAQPLGLTTRCLNPECTMTVTFTSTGRAPYYCSHHCRTRASRMRARATQQLEVISTALANRSVHGPAREQLRNRARILRWWLAHLAPSSADAVLDDQD